MSAIFEGNMPPPGFGGAGAGGKPILRTVLWSHKIVSSSANGCVRSLCVLREGRPYWTFYAKKGEVGCDIVRSVMRELFELAAGLSADLETYEIVWFLSMIRAAADDLSKHVTSNVLDDDDDEGGA